MSSTRIRNIAALAATAGLTAAIVSVVPSLAADSGATTTPTATAPAPGAPPQGRGCPGGPGGPGGGPLGIVGAAMRPDPPAGAPGPKARGAKQGKAAGRRAGGPPAGGPAGDPDERLTQRTAHLTAIGKELNKSAAEVTAAVRGALVNHLDARVKDGALTQAREEELLKAWDAGTRPAKPSDADRPAAGDRPTPAEHQAAVTAFRKDVASALGVSVEDLVKAIDAAKPTKAEKAARKAQRKAHKG